MAGFFGLFGGKKDQVPESKEAFFLSEDDAKTFGDIDYMRKEVVVRRTFAKKKGQAEEMESVRSISSGTAKEVGEAPRPTPSFGTYTSTFSAPASKPAPAAPAPKPAAPATPAPKKAEATPAASSEPAAPAAPAPTPKREPDTSMDMFRNMAKNMRR